MARSSPSLQLVTRLPHNILDVIGESKLANPLVNLAIVSYTEQWSALAPAEVQMLGGKPSCSSSTTNNVFGQGLRVSQNAAHTVPNPYLPTPSFSRMMP